MKKINLIIAACILTSGCWLLESVDGPEEISGNRNGKMKTRGEQISEGIANTGRSVGGPIGFGITLGGLVLAKLFYEFRKKKKRK